MFPVEPDETPYQKTDKVLPFLRCFWSRLTISISKDTYKNVFFIYRALLIADLMAKDSKTSEKQTNFCSNLLTPRMRYDVNR